MDVYKIGDIVIGTVTGIEKYGIFVSMQNNYTGLIHISEISDKFVSDINNYVNIGDSIRVRILDIDDDNHHLKLSIKHIEYKVVERKQTRIEETIHGFHTLKKYMPKWTSKRLNEITIDKKIKKYSIKY